jgi:hypothetical protein
VDLAEGARQRLFTARHRDHVDMIGHEAVAENLEVMVLGIFLQQLQVYPAVRWGKEHVTLTVAALCNMMRTSGYDDPRKSWHPIRNGAPPLPELSQNRDCSVCP